MNFFSKYFLWLSLLFLFVTYGCIQKQVSPTENKQQNATHIPTKAQTKKMKSIKQIYYIHVVRWDGESLSLISRWYLGNYKDWKLLAKHNTELNPDSIHVGDRVWIPKEAMKTFQPMPESLLNKNKNQKNKKSIELYGPKDHKEKAEEYSHD